ncbi:MAG: precorrin-6y C5,15-methyltransferase (decarboxylating) subunit CbiE [Clostridia bacterium]|nr:precorrin-6y C5,15-methyltransferase (decarboxylating) subunit CbiE [Clostridia bacterium]
MNEIIVIGGGSGVFEYILPAAQNAIASADYVIAGKRFAKFIPEHKWYPFDKMDSVSSLIEKLILKGSVAVVVSGDPLMYSFYRIIKEKFKDINIKVIPGVGSLQLIGAKFGITMENAKVLSLHGRKVEDGKIVMTVYENETVFFLCSRENNPSYISTLMLQYGLEHVAVYVGANLTYNDEILDCGTPKQIRERNYPDLCVVIVKNEKPEPCRRKPFLKDSDFIRNKVPMTKGEIRAIVLSKLQISACSTVWDIGAGTGSISVEVSRQCPFGKIYAVEKSEAAIDVLEKNKAKFYCDNLNIVRGSALSCIRTLPVPHAVFIGGSDGELEGIFEYIKSLDREINIVMTAVTIETQNKAYEIMKDMPEFDIVQISINRGKKIGGYMMFEGNNPITIFSANTKERLS